MIVTKLWAKITIQSRVAGVDSLGQPSLSWETFAEDYADPRFLKGLESLRADAVTSVVKVSFRIRHRDGVTEGMRVLWEGDAYNILAVLPQGRREAMDLTCELVK